jgi:hypothetical protein
MVRHASLFSQLITLFNRQRFYELVFKHGSERYRKGFNSWDHFVATELGINPELVGPTANTRSR